MLSNGHHQQGSSIICYCVRLFQHVPDSSSPESLLSLHQATNEEAAELALGAAHKKPSTGLSRRSNLQRAGSVKNLISKFSDPDYEPRSTTSSFGTGQLKKAVSVEVLECTVSKLGPSTTSSAAQDKPVPIITVVPAISENTQNGGASMQRGSKASRITARIDCPIAAIKTQTADSGRDSVADSGMGSVRRPNAVMLLHQMKSSLHEDGTAAWHWRFLKPFCCMIKAANAWQCKGSKKFPRRPIILIKMCSCSLTDLTNPALLRDSSLQTLIVLSLVYAPCWFLVHEKWFLFYILLLQELGLLPCGKTQ